MANSPRFKLEDYSDTDIEEVFLAMPELRQRWMNGEISTLEARVVYKAIKKIFLEQMVKRGEENDK